MERKEEILKDTLELNKAELLRKVYDKQINITYSLLSDMRLNFSNDIAKIINDNNFTEDSKEYEVIETIVGSFFNSIDKSLLDFNKQFKNNLSSDSKDFTFTENVLKLLNNKNN